jgi:hypothetical protein
MYINSDTLHTRASLGIRPSWTPNNSFSIYGLYIQKGHKESQNLPRKIPNRDFHAPGMVNLDAIEECGRPVINLWLHTYFSAEIAVPIVQYPGSTLVVCDRTMDSIKSGYRNDKTQISSVAGSNPPQAACKIHETIRRGSCKRLYTGNRLAMVHAGTSGR